MDCAGRLAIIPRKKPGLLLPSCGAGTRRCKTPKRDRRQNPGWTAPAGLRSFRGKNLDCCFRRAALARAAARRHNVTGDKTRGAPRCPRYRSFIRSAAMPGQTVGPARHGHSLTRRRASPQRWRAAVKVSGRPHRRTHTPSEKALPPSQTHPPESYQFLCKEVLSLGRGERVTKEQRRSAKKRGLRPHVFAPLQVPKPRN